MRSPGPDLQSEPQHCKGVIFKILHLNPVTSEDMRMSLKKLK